MQTPNLPIRYSITSYGSSGPATLTQICSTIVSEGGRENSGFGVSINNGITPLSIAVGSERVLLAIRKMPANKGITIYPHQFTISSPDTNDARWSVWVNPITSSNLSWQTMPNVNLQYATGSTETITLSPTSAPVASGYILGGTVQSAGGSGASSIDHFQGIGFDLDNNADVLVLSVQSIGGTKGYHASWDFQVEI